MIRPGMGRVLTWLREYRILSVEEDPMKQDKTLMTIMTMNLRFGLAQDGENGWQHRKSLVAELLKKYRSDFLGFQEVNHFQAEFLTRTLDGYKVIGQHNKGIDRWQSNLIFFHRSWKCLEQKHYFLSDTPDVTSRLAGSKWPRQCVIGLFQREDHQIIVANTHFDFDPAVQEKSAGLVMGFLSEFPLTFPLSLLGILMPTQVPWPMACLNVRGLTQCLTRCLIRTLLPPFMDLKAGTRANRLTGFFTKGGWYRFLSRSLQTLFQTDFLRTIIRFGPGLSGLTGGRSR